MRELDKLEVYLKAKGIRYKRIDEIPEGMIKVYKAHGIYQPGMLERHQIIVPDERGGWDVICQWGSYGFSEGLLELYGSLVRKSDDDAVVGWLTAEDVIKRIEGRM